MCYCQHTKMGSNSNHILEGLSVVDNFEQLTINKLHLLKQGKTWLNNKRSNNNKKTTAATAKKKKKKKRKKKKKKKKKKVKEAAMLSKNVISSIAWLTHSVLPSMYQYYQTQLNTNKHVDKSHCKVSTQGADANIYW